MSMQPFRTLYRQFLFRIIDLEVLSTQADTAKLLGQFASLLIFVSLVLTLVLLGALSNSVRPLAHLLAGWDVQLIMITTTMLVVGLFAVLSWESFFPDRLDVFVLAPLPVPARTLFLAKVAAAGTGLAAAILLLNAFAGLFLPPAFSSFQQGTRVPTLAALPAAPPMLPAQVRASLEQGGLHHLPPGVGIAVGVVERGEKRVFTYGTARPDCIFDIGSITKTFTGLLLADLLVQGKLKLDEPVRALLPNLTGKPSSSEMTLLDLATHRSGLPAFLPNSQKGEDAVETLCYLAKKGTGKPKETRFAYSNLGYVVLGQALLSRTRISYPNLLRTEFTGPLGLKDTTVSLSDEQRRRMMPGHDRDFKPVAAWTEDALPSSGAIRSTVDDMLAYLEVQLHPDRAGALAAAVVESHKLQGEIPGGRRIALGWHYDPRPGVYLHGGSMPGFDSYAFFNPKRDFAAVALVNVRPDAISLAELIGEHIRQRLEGEPAISLESVGTPANTGLTGLIRSYAAYWITMLAAGLFVFCAVLGLQGLAAQILPRPWFLRASSFLQLGVFGALVCGYFLEPHFATAPMLFAAQGGGALSWSPSFWFLGLFQQLSGSPALSGLAYKAWSGLAIALTATVAAHALCYLRSLRRIGEEPDIVPAHRRSGWLPRFGGPFETAVVQFSIRSLLRSRQHRLILAFYVGIGFAITVLFLRTPLAQRLSGDSSNLWESASVPLIASTLVMMGFSMAGMRIVFSLPLDLRANWSFRLAADAGNQVHLSARRYAFWALGVFPLWMASTVLLFAVWPWRTAAGHALVLGLVGGILTEFCLMGTQKLPFTCSYLPGRSHIHLTFWLCIQLIIVLVAVAAKFERQALQNPVLCGALALALAGVVAGMMWRNDVSARENQEVVFDEIGTPAVQSLGLYKDGVLTIRG